MWLDLVCWVIYKGSNKRKEKFFKDIFIIWYFLYTAQQVYREWDDTAP